MTDLFLSATDDTPAVSFSSSATVQSIKGRSMPEDSHGFYAPIIGWVDGLRTDVSTGFSFEFHFEYLNTSSTKQVLQLLQAIDSQIDHLGHRITWMYDEGDRGMLKTGMLLQKLLKNPIEFREVQD